MCGKHHCTVMIMIQMVTTTTNDEMYFSTTRLVAQYTNSKSYVWSWTSNSTKLDGWFIQIIVKMRCGKYRTGGPSAKSKRLLGLGKSTWTKHISVILGIFGWRYHRTGYYWQCLFSIYLGIQLITGKVLMFFQLKRHGLTQNVILFHPRHLLLHLFYRKPIHHYR